MHAEFFGPFAGMAECVCVCAVCERENEAEREKWRRQKATKEERATMSHVPASFSPYYHS